MKKSILILTLLLFLLPGCAQRTKKGTTKPGVKSVQTTILDKSFDFSKIEKFYFYTERNNEAEIETVKELRKTVLSAGLQIVDEYEEADIIVKSSQKLMDWRFHVYVMKAGGIMRNEENIAIVVADSADKCARETVKLFGK